jgi:hypothetical protein
MAGKKALIQRERITTCMSKETMEQVEYLKVFKCKHTRAGVIEVAVQELYERAVKEKEELDRLPVEEVRPDDYYDRTRHSWIDGRTGEMISKDKVFKNSRATEIVTEIVTELVTEDTSEEVGVMVDSKEGVTRGFDPATGW